MKEPTMASHLRPKVLMCHNYYAEPGGESRVFEFEVAGLRSRGHEVVVYSRTNTELDEFSICDKMARLPEIFHSRRTRRDIEELVYREEPDLAIIQNVFPLISPAIYETLHRLGVPIIQSVFNYRLGCTNGHLFTHGSICERCLGGNHLHGIVHRCYQGSALSSALLGSVLMYHRAIGTFSEKINLFMVPDHFLKRKIIAAGIPEEKIRVNVNPFFIDEYQCSRTHDGYFVFVGRLCRQKGVLTLLQAIRRTRYPVRMVIIGVGELAGQVEAASGELGNERVDFRGPLWGVGARDVIARAKAVIIPSEWYDNLPIALCEANALGRPVIASHIDGIPEYIRPGSNGWLVNPGDGNDLARAIDRVYQLPNAEWEEMARRSRHIAETQFDYSAHYKALWHIIEQLIGRHRKV